MYKRTRWGFAALAILVGLCLWLFASVDIKYGIDLRGGTLLSYKLDLSQIDQDRSSVAEQVKDIIARRLNSYGLKEISVAVQGEDHLIVRLPGTDPQSAEEIKRQIRTAGNLTFRLVTGGPDDGTSADLNSVEEEERDYLVADRRWVREKLAAEEAGRDFAERRPQPPLELVRWYDTEDTDGSGGTIKRRYSLSNEHEYDVETGSWLPDGVVSGSFLNRVMATTDQNLRPAVSFEFQGEGARMFGDLTGKNIGRNLAILLDDDVMQVAEIKDRISTQGQLSGSFTDKEVFGIVTVLRGGSLPTKPQLESESTVGSVLGQDSIDASFRAMAFALLAVLLFMLFYYMLGGLVANIALALNVFFILAYVVCFRQDLTLPGIAGILLTIGMAVDANILIYERVREERKAGKSLQRALTTGYQRAFWVIFDSNLTTLLTGFVLFNFGTGPVRGFAITLISGIIASFFTSIFVTRLIISLLFKLGLMKEFRMLQLFETPRIPFVAKQKPFFIASFAVIAVTWVFVIMRGQSNFGIDFNGGAQISMNLNKVVSVADMRKLVVGLKADNPDLFLDHNLQTVDSGASGGSKSYILLTRPKDEPAVEGAIVANPAERVRQVLEARLNAEGLLLPNPFPVIDWKADEDGGALTGSSILSLDVNLLEVSPQLTNERLKIDLNNLLDADPLIAGRAEGVPSTFTGVKIASVEPVRTDPLGISTYRVTTTSYQPPQPGSSSLGKVPSQQQVSEALRGYFSTPQKEDGGALFVLAEPFSQVDTVSGSVARTLQGDAIIAIFISMLGIVFYVSLRFEFIFGLGAVAALFHDIMMAVGVAAFTDHFFSGVFPVKINLTEVAAILTIIGFSINDTIVIFDRIRENLQLPGKRKLKFADIVDMSINQTLARTIWTSLTSLLVVVVLLGFGGVAVRGFAFIFCVGIISGTYSTVFIAGPIVIWLHERSVQRREEAAAVSA